MKNSTLRLLAWGTAALFLYAAGALARVEAAAASGAACVQSGSMASATVPISSGSTVRQVRLFLPRSYDATHAIPLVFDLHGSGGSGADQAATSNLAATAEKAGFAVVWVDGGITMPKGFDAHYWNIPGQPGEPPLAANAPDEVRFFSDAIDQLASRYCIDLERVYATGFSGGGRMSSLLACRLANRIAAIAPVAGLRAGVPVGDGSRPDPASCRPSRAVPVITFHGIDDNTNPYTGGGTNYWQYGVEAAVSRWVEIDGCRASPVVEKVTAHVERRRYVECRDGVVVEFNRILLPGDQGGGHAWPGSPGGTREIDASERIWEFLSQYRLTN